MLSYFCYKTWSLNLIVLALILKFSYICLDPGWLFLKLQNSLHYQWHDSRVLVYKEHIMSTTRKNMFREWEHLCVNVCICVCAGDLYINLTKMFSFCPKFVIWVSKLNILIMVLILILICIIVLIFFHLLS